MDYRSLAYKTAQRYGINPDLFVRQIQAESAFNPAAVSSAGAIGLGQLMPATAKELGVDPTDPTQNLEGAARYMKQLLGRYKGNQTLALAAYNAGMGNVDKAGGVPNFKETQNYIAKIMGSNMAQQPTQQQTQQPQQQGLLGGLLSGQGIGGALGLSDDMRDRLRMGILAGSDPRAFATQIAGAQQAIAARRQDRQKQAGRNATADYLDSVGQGELAKLLRAGGINASTAFGAIPKAAKDTALIKQAKAAGLKEGTPEFRKYILSGGDIYSQKTALLSTLPPPEKGMRYQFEEDEMGNITNYKLVPITGSAADKEAEQLQNAANAQRAAQSASGMVVLQDISKAIEIAKENPNISTGFIGSLLRNVGGTPARDLGALTTTIKANIGFDRLQRMRDESPTGGALGQVAVQELEALQSTLGSLDTSQTNEQFVGNLERLEAQYQKSMREIYNAALRDQAEGKINKKTGRLISPLDYFSEGDISVLSGQSQSQPTQTRSDDDLLKKYGGG